jgi:membrane peptidoglycan carboxypeptidase
VLFIAFVLAPVTWVGLYLFIDPPATTLMMQRAAEGEDISYHPVRVNRISPHVVRSVIAAEDANFCNHDGFDVEAIQDALRSNARGGRPSVQMRAAGAYAARPRSVSKSQRTCSCGRNARGCARGSRPTSPR